MVMVIIGLLFLGILAGSFINALVWRTRKGMSVARGRSMCVHCRRVLAWYDLLPVFSWLALKGRCRYCKKSISVQYPLVELATAALFGLSYLAWPRQLDSGFEWVYFGLWLAALVLIIAMAVYDLRWLELPDKLNWPFVLSGVLAAAFISSQSPVLAADRVAGMVWGWGFFAALYHVSRGKWLGGGDVKFALGMGAWLGAGKTLVAMLAAFYSASLIIIPLLLLRVVKRRQPIPFGPFLIAGTIVAMLWGQDLFDWYRAAFWPAGF